jgi:hypothetical protein
VVEFGHGDIHLDEVDVAREIQFVSQRLKVWE